MKGKLLLFFTLSALWSLSSCETVRKFRYVSEKKNWTEAQSYCRNNYDDLASLLSMEDVISLLKNREFHMDRPNSEFAWIGLSDDRGNWTWSLNGTVYDTHYTSWNPGRPLLVSTKQICTHIDLPGKWSDMDCGSKRTSVCYDGSAYIVQTTKRSWYEAQEYCRKEYIDLASAMDETENAEIAKLCFGRWPWIGLYRIPWAYWSDQQSVNFTHWQVGQPYHKDQNCVKINTNSGKWHSGYCNVKLPFVCQEKVIPQHQTRLKVKISSGADVNDPEVQRELLQQIHTMLENQGVSDFKLRWTQRDGNIFHKEEPKKEELKRYLLLDLLTWQ